MNPQETKIASQQGFAETYLCSRFCKVLRSGKAYIWRTDMTLRKLRSVLTCCIVAMSVGAPAATASARYDPQTALWESMAAGLGTKAIIDWGWAHQESEVTDWFIAGTKVTEDQMGLGAGNSTLKIAASTEVVSLQIQQRWLVAAGEIAGGPGEPMMYYRLIGVRGVMQRSDRSEKQVVVILVAPSDVVVSDLSTPRGALVIPVHSGYVEECLILADLMISANSPLPPPNLNCLPVCDCLCDATAADRNRTALRGFSACVNLCVLYSVLQCGWSCWPAGATGGPPLYAGCVGVCMLALGYPGYLPICAGACVASLALAEQGINYAHGNCLNCCTMTGAPCW